MIKKQGAPRKFFVGLEEQYKLIFPDNTKVPESMKKFGPKVIKFLQPAPTVYPSLPGTGSKFSKKIQNLIDNKPV